MSSSRSQIWSFALEQGIEADHSCKHMFDHLDVRPQGSRTFDLVLNPTETFDEQQQNSENLESSASNVNCIISLILAASVHPDVLNIEVNTPITADDFESQWLTQSGSTGNRPFFHAGLTGEGQIVSVVDSGLDMDHPSFGPKDEGVKDVSFFQILP